MFKNIFFQPYRAGAKSRRRACSQTSAQAGTPQEVALPHSKGISLLTAAVRLACEATERHGTPWQAIINSLRHSALGERMTRVAYVAAPVQFAPRDGSTAQF